METEGMLYNSPLGALTVLTQRLGTYESRFHMESEVFFDKYCKGLMQASRDFTAWANDYDHYIMLKIEMDRCFHGVA